MDGVDTLAPRCYPSPSQENLQEENPVQAEACPECRSYLKLCRMDQDAEVEPLADDLASLTLDLLMSEEGFGRSGVNYLMLQGE
ncbi:MAG TPA: formate dehydrogenase accessory protein FdhE [Candidatus Contendobacter sp.]|nr:formate dehydrogenase accessory protein FdhE [Candidatus Contendobacter sp.]HRZ24575.1 formate dehydrogenase accessory protein FdhE [Candidatus Contendobacter sp.]